MYATTRTTAHWEGFAIQRSWLAPSYRPRRPRSHGSAAAPAPALQSGQRLRLRSRQYALPRLRIVAIDPGQGNRRVALVRRQRWQWHDSRGAKRWNTHHHLEVGHPARRVGGSHRDQGRRFKGREDEDRGRSEASGGQEQALAGGPVATRRPHHPCVGSRGLEILRNRPRIARVHSGHMGNSAYRRHG